MQQYLLNHLIEIYLPVRLFVVWWSNTPSSKKVFLNFVNKNSITNWCPLASET